MNHGYSFSFAIALITLFFGCGEHQTNAPSPGTGGAGGMESPIPPSGPCAEQEDGYRISEGSFGACAFETSCAEDGTQERVDEVCENGRTVEVLVVEVCTETLMESS